uniref:Peptidase M12B domain-containing protein n=1 Tax=Aplanochytrium stocchinoi TaxID=215587 RepID=A0A7S3PQQ6_9STRA
MANTVKIRRRNNVGVNVFIFCWLFSACLNFGLAKPLIINRFSLINDGRELSKNGRILDDEKLVHVNTPINLILGYEDETVTFNNLRRVPICSLSKSLTVRNSEGDTTYDNYECNTYVDANYDAVLTVSRKDGSIAGVVLIGGVPTHIQTGTGEESGILADVPDLGTFSCGFSELVQQKDIENENENGRRLAVAKWTNCYPGDSEPNQFRIGVFVGSKLATRLGDDDAVEIWVEGIVAMANIIYARQLNIYLVVDDITIANRLGTDSWDNPICNLSISQQFDAFNEQSRPSAQGLWHIFDDCYKPGDAIGLAYPGTLCTGNRISSGISFYSTNTWLTFAHEIGHNHGAGHSFEEGKGKTGGIMDYGDKTLNGEYQFNTKYRKDQVCSHITSSMQRCAPFRDPAIDPKKLGNGVIELGEECDCQPGQKSCRCCNNGKLTPGSKCSPHGDACCTEGCDFKPASNEATCTMPNGVDGFCANGQCNDGGCGRFGMNGFCGLWENSCKVKCKYGNNCSPMDGWTVGGKPLNHVLDGTLCPRSSTETGICSAGECVPGSIAEPPQRGDPNQVGEDSRNIAAAVGSIVVLLVVFLGAAFLIVTVMKKRRQNIQRLKTVLDVSSCGPNDYSNEMFPPNTVSNNDIGKRQPSPATGSRFPDIPIISRFEKRSRNENRVTFSDSVDDAEFYATEPETDINSRESPVPPHFNRGQKWNQATNAPKSYSPPYQPASPTKFYANPSVDVPEKPPYFPHRAGYGKPLQQQNHGRTTTPARIASGRSKVASNMQSDVISGNSNDMRGTGYTTSSNSNYSRHPKFSVKESELSTNYLSSQTKESPYLPLSSNHEQFKGVKPSQVASNNSKSNKSAINNFSTAKDKFEGGGKQRSGESFTQTRAMFEGQNGGVAGSRHPSPAKKSSPRIGKNSIGGGIGNGKSVFTYEELLREKESSNSNLDRANLEQYLSAVEFVVVFGVSKFQFDSMPEWKKNELKRKTNLF